MRSEGTPHREGTAIMSCPRGWKKENMAPNQSLGRCPSLVCSVPLGHGESCAHGSTCSGDGKPGRCPSLVCGVPLGHGFAPKGRLHTSPGCNPGKTWHLVCGVPLGHGESCAHGSTSSGDGKPGRCPSLVCGVPLGHGFAPKGRLHISPGCNPGNSGAGLPGSAAHRDRLRQAGRRRRRCLAAPSRDRRTVSPPAWT